MQSIQRQKVYNFPLLIVSRPSATPTAPFKKKGTTYRRFQRKMVTMTSNGKYGPPITNKLPGQPPAHIHPYTYISKEHSKQLPAYFKMTMLGLHIASSPESMTSSSLLPVKEQYEPSP